MLRRRPARCLARLLRGWPGGLTAWLNPQRSLRARFALVLGGSGLVFALLLALVVDRYQRAQLVDSLGQAMRREALLQSRSLNLALQDRLQQLRQTAAQPLLASGLMEPGDVRLLLEALRAQQPELAWLATTDAKGQVQVATNTLLLGEALGAEAWFAPAIKGPHIGLRRPAGRLANHLGLGPDGQATGLIDLATPLIDFEGRSRGVLVARLRADWLDSLHQAMLAPGRSLPGSDSLVLDRDGRVLVGPAAWRDQRLHLPGLAALQAGAAPGLLRWGADGEFVTAAGADDDTSSGAVAGLSVVLRQPAALAFQAADVLRQRLLWLGAGAAALFLLISLWLAQRIARPVQALSLAARRVGLGEAPDFQPRRAGLAARRNDELAELGRSLQAVHLALAQRLAAQQQATQRFETLFQGAPVAICLIHQRRLLMANAACLQLYGATAVSQLLGKTAPELFHPDDLPQLHARNTALQAWQPNGPAPLPLEHRILRLDGQVRLVTSTAVPLSQGPWQGLQVVLHDVTEQRRDQALLRQREAQLAQNSEALRSLNADLEQRVAERTTALRAANAALDSFAYAVSHDLRAPLRAVNGFSQALLEDAGPQLDSAALGHLDQIIQASQRMAGLIDGLLQLSRTSRGVLQADTVDLSALAARAVADLQQAEPQRVVQVHIEPGLQTTGDRRMLDAALHNLIGNAWKYTGRCASPRITVTARQIDGERWYCVHDNGAGFDMAHAGRLFEAFARLHRQDEFPGMGIGLATVQRIIHRHGGQITAQATPGQGACFQFTLPARPPADATEPATP